jgi:hypothetical protein
MVQAYYNHPADITEYTVAGLSGHRSQGCLALLWKMITNCPESAGTVYSVMCAG